MEIVMVVSEIMEAEFNRPPGRRRNARDERRPNPARELVASYPGMPLAGRLQSDHKMAADFSLLTAIPAPRRNPLGTSPGAQYSGGNPEPLRTRRWTAAGGIKRHPAATG